MSNKSVRFVIKVWAAANALSKYIWNFQIYCGQEGNPHDEASPNSSSGNNNYDSSGWPCRSGKGEGLQGRHVMKLLLQDLGRKGHIVTTDNYFTSMPLFLDLIQQGIMATGTLKANRKYVPRTMFAKAMTKNRN